MERRYTHFPVETRAKAEGKSIGGYASVFDKPSQNLGGFVEVVGRSFFNKSRGDGWPDVVARFNHDDNMLLGTIAGRTLRLSVDETGLAYDVDPPAARADIYELVQRGDVRQSSFAFVTFEDDWATTEQGFPQRSLVSGRLVDVAPVVSPAYLDTTVGLRSLATKVHVDFEEIRTMSADNELRKFFERTDGKGPRQQAKPKVFGPSAVALLLSRRDDPSV
jgi:HK97 family phage prohead protease